MSKRIVYYGSTASFSDLYSNNLNVGTTDEYVNIPNNAAFQFGNGAGTNDDPFSWFVWMNRPAAIDTETLMAKYASGQESWYAILIAGTLRFQIATNAANFAARIASMRTTGSWIGLGGVWDGVRTTIAGMKIYSITTAGVVTRIDSITAFTGSYNGMGTGTAPLRFGLTGDGTFHFTGKQAGWCLVNKVLSTTEFAEFTTPLMGDVRNLSFSANVISAWNYPNGQADYPTLTDYVGGRNGTMVNQESTDINTDIPT